MQDGFQKEWVVDYLEQKRNMDFERAYSTGRNDIINGRTPTDQGRFAYELPKMLLYADDVANLEAEAEARMSGFNVDVNLPSDLPIFTVDDFNFREEMENNSDGHQVMMGNIESTFKEWKKAEKAS